MLASVKVGTPLPAYRTCLPIPVRHMVGTTSYAGCLMCRAVNELEETYNPRSLATMLPLLTYSYYDVFQCIDV
jgi:hypothetical protein